MAIIMAEGFKMYPLETAATYLTSSLLKGGWTLLTTASTNAASTSNQSFAIVPDTIFPDRAVLRFNNVSVTSRQSTSASWDFGASPAKVLLGFTVLMVPPVATPTTKYEASFGVGPLRYHVAGAAPVDSRLFFRVNFNQASIAAPLGALMVPGETTTGTTVEWNRTYHIELLLESDVNRIRLYLDGVLAGDAAYAGTVADLTKGFTIFSSRAVPGAFSFEIGNIYAAQIDSVHTGPFGPAARVLEVAPTVDSTVQFQRDTAKYGSNAAVVGQDVNSTDFVTAMDSGTKDLFNGASSLATSAAQVYGVAIKVRAQSFTADGHNMRTKVAFNGVELDNTTNIPLLVSGPTTAVRDASINPQTSAKWVPADIATAKFGYMLYN